MALYSLIRSTLKRKQRKTGKVTINKCIPPLLLLLLLLLFPVFAQILVGFRYGRDDLDVLGLNYRRDLLDVSPPTI